MSTEHLLIPHEVAGTVPQIFSGFTQDLFLALSPKLPPAKLLRYDGNNVGDIVEIRLGIPPITQVWISEIIDHDENSNEAYFIDKGIKLPFPLTYWQHKHVIRRKDDRTVVIIEDITFGTKYGWLTSLMKPFIYSQFAARGPKYKRFFTARG